MLFAEPVFCLPKFYAIMFDMDIDYVGFGKRVLLRREQLGYSQGNVPGGPSSTTLSKIERGNMRPISKDATRKLSSGLKWNQETLRAVIGGDESIGSLPIADGDGATATSVAPDIGQETLFQRLTRESDEAQAEFERLVAEMSSAEAHVDQASHRVFQYLAMENQLRLEMERRETKLGRPLTGAERFLIDEVERPTAENVAELIATHATHDPHEWTRYEMALVELFDADWPQSVTYGSGYADLGPARAKAARLKIVPEGERDEAHSQP